MGEAKRRRLIAEAEAARRREQGIEDEIAPPSKPLNSPRPIRRVAGIGSLAAIAAMLSIPGMPGPDDDPFTR